MAHVVGTVIYEMQLAIEFFELGVLVWLVWPTAAFFPLIIIRNVVYSTLDPMELKFMDDFAVLWSGPSMLF